MPGRGWLVSNETPTGTIRRAASLMRERAEAATSGPWRAASGAHDGIAYPCILTANGNPADPQTWLMATGIAGSRQGPDAAHAASMHPGVGLALAEWLDAAAQAWDEGLLWDEALNVAHVYLGSTV